MTPDDPQFFKTTDIPVEGPPRELAGYGEHPPKVRWQNDAKVAVQIVVNYEEGSEKTLCDGRRRQRHPLRAAVRARGRNAIWPSSRCTSTAAARESGGCSASSTRPVSPSPSSARAVALERNPEVGAEELAARGDETAAHGYRWSNHFEHDRDEERESIQLAIESIERTCGARPLGWYCRYGPSVNTRELVVEEGGFLYDTDAYNDDLPYFDDGHGHAAPRRPLHARLQRRRYVLGTGFGSPATSSRLPGALDRLRDDGDDVPRMMSIGLHPRFAGKPARSTRSREFIDYAQELGDVWFARRSTSRTRSSSSSRRCVGCEPR